MSALKIAIVILIVIAILFVTGIMAGRRKDTGDSDNHSDKNKKTWVDTVQGLLPASKKVKATEITGPCLRGDTIQVLANSPCALEIAKSGSFVRTLAVSLAPPPPGPAAVNAMALQKVDVELTPNAKDAAAIKALLRGERENQHSAELKVMKEGASVNVTCKAAARGVCAVKID